MIINMVCAAGLLMGVPAALATSADASPMTKHHMKHRRGVTPQENKQTRTGGQPGGGVGGS
jgi:hypothetical protein